MPEDLFAVEGEITRVVYANADTAYAVLKVLDDRRLEHVVRGDLAGLGEGQLVRFTGLWEEHPDYGRQLKVSGYELILPTTPRGMQRFLASGILPGVGPKKARKIVEAFGEETLEILDRYPGRLAEVLPISKKGVQKIIDAWKTQKGVRESQIFFQGIGITASLGNRLLKRYGDMAAEVVRSDPYRLAEEVDGIGFVKADAIASGLGIPADAPGRLAAGVLYQLNLLSLQGHVCYPREELVRLAAELLQVDPEQARSGLELAVKKRQAVLDGDTVYQALLYRTETAIPAEIDRLAGGEALTRLLTAGDTPPLHLNALQLQAVDQAGQTPLSLITGGPGVGKTTVIGEIVRRARAAGIAIALAAPTGRAAKRLSEATGLEARTLHRLLRFDPVSGGFGLGRNLQLEESLVIVDEVSMLDVHLALALLRAVKTGAALVLVGDADQLPSVGPGRVLADFIESGRFRVTALTEVFRQEKESRIILNAHRVNAGVLPQKTPRGAELQDFYWIEQEDADRTLEIIGRLVAERIPERFGFDPVDDIQVLSPMNRGSCGTARLNGMLQELLNAGEKPAFRSGERCFKLHDKVMQTANNYDRNVFNGDLGRIQAIAEGDRKFQVLFDGDRLVDYDFNEAEELMHAYAVTVHKSQGCEFPAVIVPMLPQHYMMLQRNLLYTAMTRARKLLILIGPERSVGAAVSNNRLEPRYTRLLARLKASGC